MINRCEQFKVGFWSKYARLYRIIATFRAYQLAELLPDYSTSKIIKIISASLFWVSKKSQDKEVGERLRLALQELGPVWIKFGQMLSTRRDILPQSMANQLARLQDQVTPFDNKLARQIIEASLQQPIEALFFNFEEQPIASASIAQIYRANLKSSKADVILKVLRPDILPLILSDVALMYFIAENLPIFIKGSEKLRITEIVQDYERTILKELDLFKEAENTRRLRDNFLDSNMLYIPYVYLELCSKTLLVEEYMNGVPIANIEELKRHNVDFKLLAERGVQIFFTQIFRDNFFHADMHAGNIFVDVSDPNDPRYIGIDCAVVGELTKEDQHYLAENFMAFFNRDYRKIAELYVNSGWVPENTDVYEFEKAMRSICDPIFEKSLGELSFSTLLFNLFHVARRFNMEIQPQLILLEKTLFYVEGLGRQLYPQLDLWTTAKPFLENWYRERMSAKYFVQRVAENRGMWIELLPDLPLKMLEQQRDNRYLKLKIEHLSNELNTAVQRQKQQYYWLFGVIIVAIVIYVFI